ncbi:hypothetical protein BRM23_20665, partial [Xanthomonas oryzae pv. oryzae]
MRCARRKASGHRPMHPAILHRSSRIGARSNVDGPRCITVKDAARATKVWLGFSDVTWTAAVLQKHADAAYRQAHMRCLDIAQWRAGGQLQHASDFAELASRVAEYATTPEQLLAQTRAYVKTLLPVPLKTVGELRGADALATRARESSSRLLQQLLPVA